MTKYSPTKWNSDEEYTQYEEGNFDALVFCYPQETNEYYLLGFNEEVLEQERLDEEWDFPDDDEVARRDDALWFDDDDCDCFWCRAERGETYED